jgi:ABC-type transporter MlaC component
MRSPFTLLRRARVRPWTYRSRTRVLGVGSISKAAVAMTLLMRWAAALVLSAIFATSWARAQTNPQVDEFLSRLNAIANRSPGAVSEVCARVMTSSVNLDAVAHAAASDAWARMTPQQRSAYRTAVEQRAIRQCALQDNGYNGAPLTLVGVRDGQDGDWLLATRSSHEAESHNLIWRLRGEGGHLRAVDVLFDGRSAVFTLRDRTKSLLDGNGGNIGAMIDAFNR